MTSSVVDPDPHGTALISLSWIDADPELDPEGWK
jgi:hypothetical protein